MNRISAFVTALITALFTPLLITPLLTLLVVPLITPLLTSCGSDPAPMTSIALSTTSITNDTIGQCDTIIATPTPTDAANPDVVWTHTNPDVTELTSNGYVAVVKILKQANDTIICSAAEGNGVKTMCFVTLAKEEQTDNTASDATSVETSAR